MSIQKRMLCDGGTWNYSGSDWRDRQRTWWLRCVFQCRRAVLQFAVDSSCFLHTECAQVGCYPRGNRVRAHWSGAQSPSAAPIQAPVASLACRLHFWPASYLFEVPMTPSSGLVTLLERLTDRNICLCLPVGYGEYYGGSRQTASWRGT